MSPISYQGFSFQIVSKASLATELTTNALQQAFLSNCFSQNEAMCKPNWEPGGAAIINPTPLPQTWANVLIASGPTQTSQIPREQIRDVLTLALTTTGTPNAFDVADHLLQIQLNRSAEILASAAQVRQVNEHTDAAGPDQYVQVRRQPDGSGTIVLHEHGKPDRDLMDLVNV
jgi:hypothetical protein